jgi:Arc/MetJ-type ribon-helix-helix transcriptional regulator
MAYGTIDTMMEKTTVYLPGDLHRALKEVARAERRAQAEVLRQALEEYLGRRERPRLRSVGVGEDKELSGAESEDWLRARWDGGA